MNVVAVAIVFAFVLDHWLKKEAAFDWFSFVLRTVAGSATRKAWFPLDRNAIVESYDSGMF